MNTMMAPVGAAFGQTEAPVSEDVPEPFTDKPAFYLYRTLVMPLSEWEMHTGLSREKNTPEQIAEVYKKVVGKRAVNPGLEREDFGTWHAVNTTPPNIDEEVASENALIAGRYRIDFGMISEGLATEERPERTMSVDYYIMVDPAMVRAEEPLAPREVTSAVKTAAAVGLVVGGIGTAMLVKRGVGLRVLAGVAGGVIGAGIAIQGARLFQERGAEA